MEGCDFSQGIQFCNWLGGDTGSGMGTLIMIKLRDKFPDNFLSSYSVTPSPEVSEILYRCSRSVVQYNDFCVKSQKVAVTITSS